MPEDLKMPVASGMHKKFGDMVHGETFESGYTHIAETRYDHFSDRPWDVFMKCGETEAAQLRSGVKRNFPLDKEFRLRNVKIIEV